jgi:hypothetical protein
MEFAGTFRIALNDEVKSTSALEIHRRSKLPASSVPELTQTSMWIRRYLLQSKQTRVPATLA